jgi:hypothetical protein
MSTNISRREKLYVPVVCRWLLDDLLWCPPFLLLYNLLDNTFQQPVPYRMHNTDTVRNGSQFLTDTRVMEVTETSLHYWLDGADRGGGPAPCVLDTVGWFG